MSDLRKAAQMALEVLAAESVGELVNASEVNDLISRLEAALAQPEPEPVALNENEADPYVLWAEIARLRAAVAGPKGFATWQDAATDERVRRVRAEQALAAAPTVVEPVAWMNEHGHIDRGLDAILDPTGWTPLYAHPPQRKPLTEEEIYKLFGWYAVPFIRAVEKAHGIE